MSVFDNLSAEDKYLIRMYTTARQFRDAITPNEYLQFRNGQIRNRVYPYVVNRAFSCELYLKMILCHAGKPYKSGHSILQLLAQAEAKELFMDWVLNIIVILLHRSAAIPISWYTVFFNNASINRSSPIKRLNRKINIAANGNVLLWKLNAPPTSTSR